MGIRIGEGHKERDWRKIASAAAEAATQAFVLSTNGFSNAVSALFRGLEALRGDDTAELRATNLVIETLTYAVANSVTSVRLTRSPQRPELESFIEATLTRASALCLSGEVELERSHLEHPLTFKLFADAADRIGQDLKAFGYKEKSANAKAIFANAIAVGLNRIRTRRPEYFQPVVEVLTGPDATASSREKSWDEYRSRLVTRFEDAVLFGEPADGGVTAGQVYQPLRAWWREADETGEVDSRRPPQKERKPVVHVDVLESFVLDWLSQSDKTDRIRLVSGGPGSGKSTFAKRIAAHLAINPMWRVLFVPLQRLKGTGSLGGRIDSYFHDERDEPFDAASLPASSLGRDGHADWLIIFDGLDELAKEGTGSESAALDFAAALADWRVQIGDSAAVRFLVLGRVPSMQEARKRLNLTGRGTLHVAGMRPLKDDEYEIDWDRTTIKGNKSLVELDQRKEFWIRWAVAKGISTDPPDAIEEEALGDLTKEPLLAYLLILSGYVNERWAEAAENRNRIYSAIFDKIWQRESAKGTRGHLNMIGQHGFNALMESLGLAAWGGGGRTGDEATYAKMRDTYMRPDLLAQARACGAADLTNVAILFYTRKDEESGRGYEFLHKSFGEYLTARALVDAFRRWGEQFKNPMQDFGARDFFDRWLVLTGQAAITPEISLFLANEFRLQSFLANEQESWSSARQWTEIASDLINISLLEGLPAHQSDHASWRRAEWVQRNSEEVLWAMLNATARAAYPNALFEQPPEKGGWSSGPIVIAALESPNAFSDLLARILNGETFSAAVRLSNGGSRYYNFPSYPEYFYNATTDRIFLRFLSHLDLTKGGAKLISLQKADFSGGKFSGCPFRGTQFNGADFQRANLDEAVFVEGIYDRCDFDSASLVGAYALEASFIGASFMDANLRRTNFRQSQLSRATFIGAVLTGTDFRRADLTGSIFRGADLTKAKLIGANLEAVDFRDANLRGVNLSGMNLRGARLQRANLVGANLAGANLSGSSLRGALFDGADLTGTNFTDTMLENQLPATISKKVR